MIQSRFKINLILTLLFIFCAVWVAEANIVVRAVVVNTSPSQKRKIPFKSYLPKEIQPKDVVDMGDLDIAFDPKEGAYYVYKDYELDPKQVIQVEIELSDVWKFPQDELNALRADANKVTQTLASTDFRERAMFLKNDIETKLTQIEQAQKVDNPSPGGYISDYRENLKTMEIVKTDLEAARSLVVQAKNISPMITWKLVMAIVAFLGVLGLIFFIIWQRQIKSLSSLSEDFQGSSKGSSSMRPPAEEGERREVQEDKKSEISDIEKRLRENR